MGWDWICATALLEPGTEQGLVRQWRCLLDAAIAQPDRLAAALQLLDAAQRQAVRRWRGAPCEPTESRRKKPAPSTAKYRLGRCAASKRWMSPKASAGGASPSRRPLLKPPFRACEVFQRCKPRLLPQLQLTRTQRYPFQHRDNSILNRPAKESRRASVRTEIVNTGFKVSPDEFIQGTNLVH